MNRDLADGKLPSLGERRATLVQGRSVEYVVRGEGLPLIALESGLGDDLTSWSSVIGILAERSRTLAYSRPGFGGSAEPGTPRDLSTEAQELRTLLKELEEVAPYLLVGHSWGGLIVQAFAAAYPAEIAGLVLVDSAHPDLMERLRRDTPADAEAFQRLAATYSGAARGELDALAAPGGGDPWQDDAPYTGPMIILGAWDFAFNDSREFRRHHRIRIEEIAATYPQAELRRISCGHYIQRERPLAVVDAVDEVLARLHAKRVAGGGRADV